MLHRNPFAVLVCLGVLAACSAAHAGFGSFVSGSDGSDGPLTVSSAAILTIDLGQATTGSWQDPSPNPGKGIYDPSVFAVVYKFSSISLATSATINFINHPSGAPVVWLVEGNVTLQSGATINLNGQTGVLGNLASLGYPIPGPGGFSGGRPGTNGFGPGGGHAGIFDNTSADFGGGGGGFTQPGANGSQGVPGGATYGNAQLLPIIGGSGGGGDSDVSQAGGGPLNTTSTVSGGAGGGAILIAANGTIQFNGTARINANGGNAAGQLISSAVGTSNATGGAGAGGGIKLMANSIALSPSAVSLVAVGGTGSGVATPPSFGGAGSPGRIRLEAFSISAPFSTPTNPPYTFSTPGPIFPDASTPTLRAVSVNNIPISTDPGAGVQSIDAAVVTTDSLVLTIEATNIEPGSIVEVLIFQANGNPLLYESTPLAGNFRFSTATAEIALNSGIAGDIVLRVQAEVVEE